VDAIRGRLLSSAFVRTVLPTLPGATPPSFEVERQLEQVGETADARLGPTSSARAVGDTVLLPLLRALDLRVLRRHDRSDAVRVDAGGRGPGVVPVLVLGWADDLDLAWRGLVRDGIAADARWCLATNGRQVRFVDAHRTWSRHWIDLDTAGLAHDSSVRRLVWMIGNNDAITRVPALLDTAAQLSVEHGAEVCRSLGDGVVGALSLLFDALRRSAPRTPSESRLLEQCLTIVYRILFLLFAEARALVPVWHPLYRDQYTIGSIVSALIAGRCCRGTWQAVQAISRIAHAGCTAGALSVTAFNGRLFSPAHTAGIEERRVDDEVMRRVVLGLGTTHHARAGVARTRYEELDVEQLGSVYEHVLEYQPGPARGSALVRTRDARKASGTFYTPREIAASLVARTLEPLVAGRTAEQILSLRILDPAMGSGAFLVAACRFLARRVEEALMTDGTWHVGEIADADRTSLRREIVQRCLYGVDLNPIAAQLARLSLWLVALAHDKPLSFLDHHLVVGNSLVGATPPDIHRAPGGTRVARGSTGELPLFDEGQLATSLAVAGQVRKAIALEPDDTVDCVRSKERRLASLVRSDSALAIWKRVLDFWCATWFWDDASPPSRATFNDISEGLLTGRSALGQRLIDDLLSRSDRCADEKGFLHWPLAFPEVFQDEHGQSGTGTGFDAVIGNPPWDMVRGDSGDDVSRGARRDDARHLTRFVRDSGIYRTSARAHLNRYALFTERAMQLVRHSGRIGLVLPAGVLTDTGTAPLRTQLLSTMSVDGVVGLDNRAGIFQVHRSLKFVLLTATAGAETRAIRCRFGVSRLDDLEDAWGAANSLTLTRAFLERVSGADDLGLPDLASADDLRIVEMITASVPALAEARGWHVRFGRELNASDDRGLMMPAEANPEGRRVVEGKFLTPFRISLGDCRFVLAPDAERRRVLPPRARLAYREVAGSTNRLTLIAAIVPAHAVTSHTVFCLKSALPLDSQRVLCALLNSFVANYLVRMRVGTHVTAAIMSRLRVPLVEAPSEQYDTLLATARALSESEDDIESSAAFATCQALVARLYGLGEHDFSHVLSTFPLIPQPTRDACLDAFSALRR